MIKVAKNRIDPRRGAGTTYLSVGMVILCFVAVLMLFRNHEMFNAANQVQIVADAVNDGAVVASQDPFGLLDEYTLPDQVSELIAANTANSGGITNRLRYAKQVLQVEQNHDRAIYTDYLVTLRLEGSYKSPFELELDSNSFRVARTSKVLSMSTRPTNLRLTKQDLEVLRFAYKRLQQLEVDANSYRYRAIQLGSTMLHWGYPQAGQSRWYYNPSTGYGIRDCSSFVITAYRNCTNFFVARDGYTQTIYSRALANGCFTRWDTIANQLRSGVALDDILIPGDLILTCGPRMSDVARGYGAWSRNQGIVHVMIYMGNGYVMHADGGSPDGVHTTYYSNSRWQRVGRKLSNDAGHSGMFGLVRIPESMTVGTGIVYDY